MDQVTRYRGVHVHTCIDTYMHTYTHAHEQKEMWVRSHAAMVLIFEGIVTGVYNYDYSSCAVAIGKHCARVCVCKYAYLRGL